MASWASRVTQGQVETPVVCDDDLAGKKVTVLDANAIIDLGASALSPDCVYFTTEGCMREIRDKRSRAAVAAMPMRLREPTGESLRAVRAFAQKTGDLHQLSSVDVSILALTYALEESVQGVAHLRSVPAPIRTRRRARGGNGMPGWGSDEGADWSIVDAAPDADDVAGDEALSQSSTCSVQRKVEHEIEQDGWNVAKPSRNALRRAVRKARTRLIRASVNGSSLPEESMCKHFDQDLDVTVQEWKGSSSVKSSGTDSDQEEPVLTGAAVTGECTVESKVALVSRDFPMQNVALQMGLRLETRGGVMISHVQRAILRCDACHAVCPNTTKIFCPTCGHASLSRVSVTVGPDGAEQFGVRKKHVLRGTRFPLPKPRGGRSSTNPILSEDVYNARVRRPKQVKDEEGQLAPVNVAREQQPHVARALEYLKTNWRNNPNERRAIARSNRRK